MPCAQSSPVTVPELSFRCPSSLRSFREPVRYDLSQRGLVVVTGQVQDTAEAGKWAGLRGTHWARLGGQVGGEDALQAHATCRC